MRRWTTFAWSVLVAVGLAGAGRVAGIQAGSPDFELRQCSARAPDPVQADCGRLTVFENRAAGRGRRIDIHFTVVRADRPDARQALFLFAGGPGAGQHGPGGTGRGLGQAGPRHPRHRDGGPARNTGMPEVCR